MNIWDDILNRPILDTRDSLFSDSVSVALNNLDIPEGMQGDDSGFVFAPINLILFIVIFIIGKLALKYLKRYFKVLHLDDKQIKIEGREFALWKIIKQFIYFLIFYACFQSLNINNDNIDLGNILVYDFVKIGNFHISVYHIFLVSVVLFIARLFINFLKVYLLKKVSKHSKIDQGSQFVIIQLAKYITYTIAIIVIVRSFGIRLDLLIGGSAALLVGVGLGLQDVFRDFISGLILLFESSTKVGDVVEIEHVIGENSMIAKIKEINLRTTKVITRDEKTLIIPNSILTQRTVNNWSYTDNPTRFQIPISVHYNTELEIVKEILVNCALQHPKVKNNHPIFVRMLKFGDYGLELDLVFYAEQMFYVDMVKSEIMFAIEKEFKKHGIVVPYPQSEVYIKNFSEGNIKSKED
jgi:small-conductance mechanosensitive channel